MSVTPEEQAAEDRLGKYNGGRYDRFTNPYAFDYGGSQAGVFVQALNDIGTISKAIRRNTGIVEDAIDAINDGAVISVVGKGGIITAEHIRAAISTDLALTGTPTAPTPDATDNDTSIATTAMVQAVADAHELNPTQVALTIAYTGVR